MSCCIASAWVALLSIAKNDLPHGDASVALLPIVRRPACCMLLGGRLVVLPLGPSVSVGLLDVTYASLRLLGWPWADVLLHC